MEQQRKKRKLLPLIMLITGSVLLLTGIVAAFFSDLISDTKQGSFGSLRISGGYTYHINGEEVTGEPITNLTPGDVIHISATVGNIGNKSAWIRDMITFEGADSEVLDNLMIYEGNYSREAIVGGGLEDNRLTVNNGVYATAVKIIDGINIDGNDAQTEGIENPVAGYNYLKSSTYVMTITIYFDIDTGNSAQDTDFSITISTAAIQYRNNNSAVPSDAAWLAAEPAPII